MNPNKAAIERIKTMPKLAGREPRTAFNLGLVVMEDLNRKPCSGPCAKPIQPIEKFKGLWV